MSKKKNFTLKNINNIDVIKKYSLNKNTQPEQYSDNEDITFINELSINNDKKSYSFMDDSKQTHNCVITMINNNKILKKSDNQKCFWCKNKFDSQPLGCPIKFIPTEIIKKHYSYINNENYVIREKTHKVIDKSDTSSNVNNFYETDGIFCSFNCCYSYINDNKRNYLYKDSLMLLSKIYFDLFSVTFNIIPAPNWRLIDEFGGNMTITQFRKSFSKIEYLDVDQHITKLPIQYPIGYIYEEKIKF